MKPFDLKKPRKMDLIVIAVVSLVNTIIFSVAGLIWQATVFAILASYFGFKAKKAIAGGQ